MRTRSVWSTRRVVACVAAVTAVGAGVLVVGGLRDGDATGRDGVAVLTASQLHTVTGGGLTPAVFSTAGDDGEADAVRDVVVDAVSPDLDVVDYTALLSTVAEQIQHPVALVVPDGVNSVSPNHARTSWSMHGVAGDDKAHITGLVSAEEAQAQAWDWLTHHDGGVIAVIPQEMLATPAPAAVDTIDDRASEASGGAACSRRLPPVRRLAPERLAPIRVVLRMVPGVPDPPGAHVVHARHP